MSAACHSTVEISVVVPTHRRVAPLQRAIQSVLVQTYPCTELIVVVDGPDPVAVQAIEAFAEPRIRVIELQQNVGVSEARNIGVRAARCEWIAFLDDDDEWLPARLEKQVECIGASNASLNFIACRYRNADQEIERILPVRFPAPDESWSEYIYCERGNWILPSEFLAKKSLLIRFPLDRRLASNEDADWLLRVRAANAITAGWVHDPLVIYHNDGNQLVRGTKLSDWERYFEWANTSVGIILTKRAYSHALVRYGIQRIKTSNAPALKKAVQLLVLVRAVFQRGELSAAIVLLMLGRIFSFSTWQQWKKNLRSRIRKSFGKNPRPLDSHIADI